MAIQILDTRLPQSGRYGEYGVPEEIGRCVDAMLAQRNAASDAIVPVIDGAILRILLPWIRDEFVEDLGSITAIDTGFDVRAQKMPVIFPLTPGVRYRLTHQTRHPKSTASVSLGTAEEICLTILLCGYEVRVSLPSGRYIAAVLNRDGAKTSVQFEVQPKNDNYWITVANLSQALVAHDYPEMYRDAPI